MYCNPYRYKFFAKKSPFSGCHAVAVKSLFSRQKIERKYLFWKNYFDGFQSKFLESFNTRFWSSRSDHGKRYFQKLDFPSSPLLLPRAHFTRESVLNDEYLSHFFPDRKVLWMTLEQLFEIFIKFNLFDCIGVIFVCLFIGFVNFRSVLGDETQNFLRETSRTWIESSWAAGLNISKSWIRDMTGTSCCRLHIHVEFVIRNQLFHR